MIAVEVGFSTALGIFATIAGVAITTRFQARPAIARRWKIVTASLALFAGLACALVWYRDPNGWVLGFPFRALHAVEGKMLEPTFETAHFAFADFVIGVATVHLLSAWFESLLRARRSARSR